MVVVGQGRNQVADVEGRRYIRRARTITAACRRSRAGVLKSTQASVRLNAGGGLARMRRSKRTLLHAGGRTLAWHLRGMRGIMACRRIQANRRFWG